MRSLPGRALILVSRAACQAYGTSSSSSYSSAECSYRSAKYARSKFTICRCRQPLQLRIAIVFPRCLHLHILFVLLICRAGLSTCRMCRSSSGPSAIVAMLKWRISVDAVRSNEWSTVSFLRDMKYQSGQFRGLWWAWYTATVRYVAERERAEANSLTSSDPAYLRSLVDKCVDRILCLPLPLPSDPCTYLFIVIGALDTASILLFRN
jgi:hypothetical protein